MKYLVLIQARCGSSRLPSKVLKDICGKPDLQRVVERVQKSSKIDEVVIVTSIGRENLPLIELCIKLGVRVYVGSENDVLDRYYQAAKLLKPEYVVRITSDCPLFDWRYLDDAIDQMDSDATCDYIWQATESYPDGLDIEIMKYTALKKAWEEARLNSEREHVTQYIRKHPELFNIQNLECPIKGIGGKRWTLDEAEDYEMIKKVYEHFISHGNEFFTTDDILEYLKEHPEIEDINSMHIRNEGLLKSLANDFVVNE